MRCYRIMSEKRYKTPFSASGASGRWNPHGVRLIYTASSPALAQLEYVCIKGNTVGLNQWHMITYEITDDSYVAELQPENLPADWASLPHPRSTQEFGRIWANAMPEPFIIVPSARLDIAFYNTDFNILINPDYPKVHDLLKVVAVVPFRYALNP